MKKYSASVQALRPARPADAPDVSRLLRLAFGFDEPRAAEYLAHAADETVFILPDDQDRALACAALLGTAHSFRGAAVPAASIAHLAIAPEARGTGLARPLVEALCDQAQARGAAMVSLFASARPVYRTCGFELAGSEIVYEADLSTVPARTEATFEALDPRDPRIAAAYRRKVAIGAGLLTRGALHWSELLRPPTDALAAFGLGGSDLEAYVILDAHDPSCLHVRDWHAATGAAATAVLAFLGQFRSVYPVARWHGGPQDDLVSAMPDKGWRLVHQEEWLANVVDPRAALAARRYLPEGMTLGLRLVKPDGSQAASLVLDIEGGVGRVGEEDTRGIPTVSVQQAAFASLFTGFRSATALSRQGLLSGGERALRTCDLAFAGPTPWVAEHF